MKIAAYLKSLLVQIGSPFYSGLWLVVGVGFFLAASSSGTTTLTSIFGALYFALPYNILIYAQEPIGRLSQKYLLVASAALAIAVVAGAAVLLHGAPIIATITLLVSLVSAASYHNKWVPMSQVAVVDSIAFSTFMIGPILFGLLRSGGHIHGWLVLGATLAWIVASHLFAAAGDAPYDQHARTRTIATYLGQASTLKLSTLLFATSALCAVVMGGWLGPLIGGILALYVINCRRFGHLGTDPKSMLASIGWRTYCQLNVVTGAVLILIIIASNNPFGWTAQVMWLSGALFLAAANVILRTPVGRLKAIWPTVMNLELIEHSELVARKVTWSLLGRAVSLDAANSFLLLNCEFGYVAAVVATGLVVTIGPYAMAIALIFNGQSALASFIALTVATGALGFSVYRRSNQHAWLIPSMLYPLSFTYQCVVMLWGASTQVEGSHPSLR